MGLFLLHRLPEPFPSEDPCLDPRLLVGPELQTDPPWTPGRPPPRAVGWWRGDVDGDDDDDGDVKDDDDDGDDGGGGQSGSRSSCSSCVKLIQVWKYW